MYPMRRIISGAMATVLLASCASTPISQYPPQATTQTREAAPQAQVAEAPPAHGQGGRQPIMEQGGPSGAPTLPWAPSSSGPDPLPAAPKLKGQAPSPWMAGAEGRAGLAAADTRKAPGSSADFSDWAEGRATGAVTGAAQAWFEQYGTAKLSLQRYGGALDLLIPLAETERGTLFTQLGARRTNQLTESYRTTVNLGLGYRYLVSDELMLGGNLFVDSNPDRGHRRLGLGGEIWSDYVKFSANGYLRQSGWKTSKDLDSYMERPASGFDLRLEGYLPQYPQLGAKVMYEKYFGEEVGLFGQDDRQRNPSAWTLGATYTPVPALSIGLERRFGQGGMTDTALKVGLKYALGVPLERQFSAAEVGNIRKVKAMRHDLVERNNEIVLEYKKVVTSSIRLPETLSGYGVAAVAFPVGVSGVAAGAYQVQWSGTAAAFVTAAPAAGAATLSFPPYVVGGANTYTLTATLLDSKGGKATSNVMTVNVNPLAVVLQPSKPLAKADGVDSIRFVATVKGVQGEPVEGQPVRWSISGAGTIGERSDRTDAGGQAVVVVTSAAVGQATLQATIGEAFSTSADVTFANTLIVIANLAANPSSIVADGTSTATLTATVVDGAGKPVPAGVDVLWQADAGALSTAASKTDANGLATAVITAPTVVGQSNVVARVAGAPDRPLVVPIVADASGARVDQIVASKQQATADGNDSITFTATVQDLRGNLVGAGVTVAWSTDLGTLVSPTSVTNAQSKASTVVVAPQTAGVARVTARASQADPGESSSVSFKIDPADARVVNLAADKTDALANGTDSVTLTATVQDLRGASIGPGILVHWSGNLPGLSGATSTTDASGRAIMVITAPTTPTVVNVTAKAAPLDGGQAESVTFKLDPTMYRVQTLGADKLYGAADSVDQVTLRALVIDASGSPVGAGISVAWTSTGGYLGRATTTTDASGTATNTLRSAWITDFQVTAKASRAGAADPGQRASIDFLGPMLALTVDKSQVAASGQDQGTATAQVRLTNGAPYAGTVRFTMGPHFFDEQGRSQFDVQTDPAGKVSVKYMSEVTGGGLGAIRAGIPMFPAIGESADVQVLPPRLTAARVNSPIGNPADGVTGVTMYAEVRHTDGVRANDIQVSWTTTLGTVSPSTVRTNSLGQAMTLLFSDVQGTANITVQAVTDPTSEQLWVNFDR